MFKFLCRSAFDNMKKNGLSDEPMASIGGENSQSMATWLVDPLGVAIGRGPTLTSPVAKKVTPVRFLSRSFSDYNYRQ